MPRAPRTPGDQRSGCGARARWSADSLERPSAWSWLRTCWTSAGPESCGRSVREARSWERCPAGDGAPISARTLHASSVWASATRTALGASAAWQARLEIGRNAWPPRRSGRSDSAPRLANRTGPSNSPSTTSHAPVVCDGGSTVRADRTAGADAPRGIAATRERSRDSRGMRASRQNRGGLSEIGFARSSYRQKGELRWPGRFRESSFGTSW